MSVKKTCGNCVYAEEGVCWNGGGEISSGYSCHMWRGRFDQELKPFNPVIQICPKCGKVDVYKDDGHACINREDKEIYDDNIYK